MNKSATLLCFRYETENGIEKNEEGTLESAEGDKLATVKGYYKYDVPGGGEIRVSYIADKDGYKPVVRFSFGSPPVSPPVITILNTAVLASLVG